MNSMFLRRRRVTVTFFCMLIFTGCATISPSKVVENPYIADGSSEEVATVNFIRVDSFFGGGVATPIYLNSKLAAKLRTETYTTLPLKPGRYDISTAKDRMKMPGAQPALAFHGELVFSPGETYYVLLFQEQYGIDQNGWPAYWIKFEIINSDKANEHMSGYEFIALNAD